MIRYLSNEDIRQIVTVVSDTDLEMKRDLLLYGINKSYLKQYLSRQTAYTDLDQIEYDLKLLNKTPRLVDENGEQEVPLLIWLDNAITRLRYTGLVDAENSLKVFKERVESKSQAGPPGNNIHENPRGIKGSSNPSVSQSLLSIIQDDQSHLEYSLAVYFYSMINYSYLKIIHEHLDVIRGTPEKMAEENFWKNGKSYVDELSVTDILEVSPECPKKLKDLNVGLKQVFETYNGLYDEWYTESESFLTGPKQIEVVPEIKNLCLSIGKLQQIADGLHQDYYEKTRDILTKIIMDVSEIARLLKSTEAAQSTEVQERGQSQWSWSAAGGEGRQIAPPSSGRKKIPDQTTDPQT